MNRNSVTAALLPVVVIMTTMVAGPSCSRQAHVVWQRRFDNGTVAFGSSVATDGRDIVVGTTCHDTTAGVPGTVWQFLRYDRDGDLQWHRPQNRGKRDVLADIAVTTDHDIIVVGCTGSNTTAEVWLDDKFGRYMSVVPVRLLLARFSAQGDVKWQKEYQFGSITRGVAVRLDTIGRIWVCGSVAPADSGTSDLLIARFDSLGNLLDSVTVDFGADETGQDLLLVPSRFHILGGIFVAGRRTPLPGKPDTLKTRDIVVVSLDPDLHENWRWVYNSGGDDLSARLSWDGGICLAVTSCEDGGVTTRVVEHNAGNCYPQFNQDTHYAGAPDARCAGLVRDRGGAMLGVGSYGSNGPQRCLGWRYLRGKFSEFLSGDRYVSGMNDWADALAFDADGNVIVAGESESGTGVGILLLKLALPRYRPPPSVWLPNMYR